MTDERLETLASSAHEEVESQAVVLIVQLVRLFRIVAVHHMNNETTQTAAEEFRGLLNEALSALSSFQLQVSRDNVYFNREFVKLKGAAFESRAQLIQLFQRLGIHEVSFAAPLEAAELDAFLTAVQVHLRDASRGSLARRRFDKILVRISDSPQDVDIDRRMELARSYAQLVVLMREGLETLPTEKNFPMARIRRALHQMVAASDGQPSLLVGLTQHRPTEGLRAIRAVATSALVLLMAQRLGLRKRALVGLGISALLAELAQDNLDDVSSSTIANVLAISRVTRSSEALERTAVALEAHLPVNGDALRRVPGMAARLIAVASAFIHLTRPAPPDRGLPADQALRLLRSREQHFDKHVMKLFLSVVGLYPPGTLVRLSGGQKAVVVATPATVEAASRPTVRIIEDRGPADYLVELSQDEAGLEIVESLDTQAAGQSITHYLLA